LARSRPLGQLGQHLGVAFPANQGGQHRPARDPSTSAATESSLLPASSKGLWGPLAFGGVGLDQPRAVAGEIPQLPDRGRRHEAAPQQPTLQQLSKPGRVTDIGLAAREDLDLAGVDQQQPEARSSRTYQTGFQDWPVASIATWMTPSAASHPANASSPEVKVGKVRTSWPRPPWPSGTRTQATTSSLATSNPAQRR
jgi:hypothetical protein